MLSSQQIQNNWPTIKTHVLSRWSKLNESEVEKTHGDKVLLNKLVQNKYGKTEEFNKNFEKLCNKCIPSSINTDTTFNKNLPQVETEINGYKATAEKMDEFHSGSPEREMNANFANIELDIKGVEPVKKQI